MSSAGTRPYSYTAEGGDTVTVYQGGDLQWYWRRTARNGQPVSAGGEGYSRKSGAKRAAVSRNPPAARLR